VRVGILQVISRAESYRRVLNEYKDWHAYYFLNYDGYEVIDAVKLMLGGLLP